MLRISSAFALPPTATEDTPPTPGAICQPESADQFRSAFDMAGIGMALVATDGRF